MSDQESRAARPWEELPVGTAADGHALIILAGGSYTPSGKNLTGPVDSIGKLDKLLQWATLERCGVSPQVWLIGDACAQLDWIIDPGSEDDYDDLEQLRTQSAEQLGQVILAGMPALTASGWEMRGNPGFVVRLSRKFGKASQNIDLFLEPYAWTYWNKDFGWNNRVGTLGVLGSPDDDTYLPDDDRAAGRELGRRLAWCVEHLGTLPGPTAARTGAAVLDSIRRPRIRSGKGVVVDSAGPIPPIDDAPRGDIEPPAGWTRNSPLDDDDFEAVSQLVTIDQRAAYLASAGMLELGYGTPENLTGAAACDAAAADKPAFGLWRVTLPAGDQFALPEKLPLPHPAMEPDRPVQTWITTVSLEGLCAPVVDGGLGVGVDDLDVTEAWVYPEQARVLDKWAKTLRDARSVALNAADVPMKQFISGCYKGYVGRMVNPDMWASKYMQHHHQPLWRAAIMAHCRWRGRRVAMRIGRDTGRWPLRTVTDSWVYLLGAHEKVADDSEALGKMAVEKQADLTEETIDALLAAHNRKDLAQAIAAAHKPTPDDAGK